MLVPADEPAVDAAGVVDMTRRPSGSNSLNVQYDERYAAGMTLTTIKVRRDIRDRLKEQATAKHRTLGEHLDYLVSLADKQQRFERLKAEIIATSPEDLASYHEETEWWESAQHG